MRIFLVVIAVVILFLMNSFVFDHAIENGLYRMAGALTKHLYGERQSGEAFSVIASDEMLRRENEMLRKQLGVGIPKSHTLQMANIVHIERNTFASSIVIDKGTSDGIIIGMPVIVAGNVLVGSVDEVFEQTSRVMLVDDPRFILSVRILGSSSLAESKGSLGGTTNLNLVSYADEVATGNIVVTSGLDAFPEALVVGKIEYVSRGENSLFKKVTASLLFDISIGPNVFILK